MDRAGVWLTIVALLFAVAPAIGQTAASDRAYWLIGTWQCRSDRLSSGTMVYVRNTDGSISLTNAFNGIGQGPPSGEYREQYRFDPRAARWTVNSAPLGGSPAFTGSAPPWGNAAWVISGQTISRAPGASMYQGAHITTTRMVYAYVDDGTFARTIDVIRGGGWLSVSGSTCRRTAPSAAPVPS